MNFSRTSANLQLEPKNAREPLDRVLTVHSGRIVDNTEVCQIFALAGIVSVLTVIRPERTKIKSGSYNFGSTNNVESAFPARVWEEMHQNVADPREFVTESCLFKLSICGLERPIVEERAAHYVGARHEAPVARVQAVVPVVAHHEIHAGWNHQVAVLDITREVHGPRLC